MRAAVGLASANLGQQLGAINVDDAAIATAVSAASVRRLTGAGSSGRATASGVTSATTEILAAMPAEPETAEEIDAALSGSLGSGPWTRPTRLRHAGRRGGAPGGPRRDRRVHPGQGPADRPRRGGGQGVRPGKRRPRRPRRRRLDLIRRTPLRAGLLGTAAVHPPQRLPPAVGRCSGRPPPLGGPRRRAPSIGRRAGRPPPLGGPAGDLPPAVGTPGRSAEAEGLSRRRGLKCHSGREAHQAERMFDLELGLDPEPAREFVRSFAERW